MKQFKLLSAFFMCLFALSFTSCSNDDDDNNSSTPSIVGIWMYEFSSGYNFDVYNQNGTGYSFEFDYQDGYRPGGIEYMTPFTYQFDEKNNILTITERSSWGVERYSCTIRELTSTKLKIINSDGYIETRTRYDGDLDDIEREFNVILKVDND